MLDFMTTTSSVNRLRRHKMLCAGRVPKSNGGVRAKRRAFGMSLQPTASAAQSMATQALLLLRTGAKRNSTQTN